MDELIVDEDVTDAPAPVVSGAILPVVTVIIHNHLLPGPRVEE